MAYLDYRWQGSPEAMEAALFGLSNVIGPRVLDGIAYAAIRSAVPLQLPAGISQIGPSLIGVVLGVWAGQAVTIPAPVGGPLDPSDGIFGEDPWSLIA